LLKTGIDLLAILVNW